MPLAKFLNHGPLTTLSQLHALPKSWAERPKHGEDASGPVVKQLLIVARDRQNLYGYAKRAFSDNSTVEVILDRRSAEALTTPRMNPPERRRGDRHLRLEIDNHLKALGWAIVRLNVFRAVGPPHGGTSN